MLRVKRALELLKTEVREDMMEAHTVDSTKPCRPRRQKETISGRPALRPGQRRPWPPKGTFSNTYKARSFYPVWDSIYNIVRHLSLACDGTVISCWVLREQREPLSLGVVVWVSLYHPYYSPVWWMPLLVPQLGEVLAVQEIGLFISEVGIWYLPWGW